MADYKALIVEDDPVAEKLLVTIAKKAGFQVDTCHNGAEALYYYCHNLDYAVILLDLMMPEVDGTQFLNIIDTLHNSNTINQPANIIIQTAAPNYSYLKKLLLHKNVFSVRTKPINRQELEADIKKIIELKESDSIQTD